MPRGLPSVQAPKRPHPVDVGQVSEAIILSELVRRGHQVLVPFGVNHRYDLVIDDGRSFVRVQCKTGRLRDGAVIFNAQSIRSNTRGSVRRAYTDEVDLFAVYCPGTEKVYVVPVDEATRTLCTLRVTAPENGQRRGVRWAADYELPA